MRILLPALCLLSACSSQAPTAADAPSACRLERAADLPMVAGTPYALVPARIDDQPVSMLLDTGDERLTITHEAQRILRLPEDTKHRTEVHGIGGTSTSFDAVIQRFELGDTELPVTGASLVDLMMHPLVDPPMAGIVGEQVMSRYDMEFDFASRHVVLWQRTGCDTIAPAWTGAWSTVDLLRGNGDLLTLDVAIDGHTIRAMLDTGALTSVIDPQAAAVLGVTAATLGAARVAVSRGADSSDVLMRRYVLRDIALGSTHVANLAVGIGAVKVPFAHMLLGVDFLQHHDLWVSYAGQKAFVR